MGTPFISLLEPTRLDGYDSSLPHDQQRDTLPPVFIDAMAAREAVFVQEQGIPLSHEYDEDDARSCHWVAYASVNIRRPPGSPGGGGTQEPGPEPEPEPGEEGQETTPAARSPETRSVPIGTLRIVPFPHPPHPPPGARYANNVLLPSSPPSTSTSTSTSTSSSSPLPSSSPPQTAQTPLERERQQSALPFGPDRRTTYHDGREPYVKLSRLAVVPDFRGLNIATQLWVAARRWLEEHPDYFNPSVAELGMDQLRVGAVGDIPRWNGLVLCHAQESAIGVYERWGFRVDQAMGKWYEEGIPHFGMFARLDIKRSDPKV
ncbi:hypothetical protein F4810DRAFT_185576 [Camillea tinctor]|nr:hypothetical protein F4810DRAFT_185576 [Camillea tinctor]